MSTSSDRRAKARSGSTIREGDLTPRDGFALQAHRGLDPCPARIPNSMNYGIDRVRFLRLRPCIESQPTVKLLSVEPKAGDAS